MEHSSDLADYLDRLGAVAALLVALANTGSSGTAFETAAACCPGSAIWEGTDASVTAIDAQSARLRAAEVALAEVTHTRTVLSMRDLAADPGFYEFLDQVKAALDAYDDSPRQTEHMTGLATSLAVARAFLQGRVTTVTRWAALASVSGQASERYVRIPDRLVSKEPFSIVREQPPSPMEVAELLGFDQVVGV